jgi:fibronectin type 3 domain-containing protein
MIAFFVMFAGQVFAQQNGVAIFQFTAKTMDAVGLENEVAYAIRNELSKRPTISLMSQREMEVELARNDIAQTFDTTQALKASQLLNVDYVLIGEVDRSFGTINAAFELVSSATNNSVNSWSLSFNNQQEVVNRSEELGDLLINAIREYQSVIQEINSTANSVNWLATLNASYRNGDLHVAWQPKDNAPEALGYNIYRANNPNGPFSYIASVLDPEFSEPVNKLKGTIYYQVALLNEEGDELRTNHVTSVDIPVVSQSNVEAPVVLSHTPLIRGVEIHILPSAKNVEFDIQAYQLLRKKPKQPWIIVDRVIVEAETKNNRSATPQKFILSDKQSDSLTGKVEYAVRAETKSEVGRLSASYAYAPVSPPILNPNTTPQLRKIILQWQPVTSGQGYQLYRREPGQQAWQKLVKLDSLNVTEYVDTDVNEDGKHYEYSIAVFDQYSLSQQSEAILLASRPPLPAPEGFNVTSGEARKITLTWQAYNDAEVIGFAVYRAEFTDNPHVLLDKIDQINDPNATQYVDQSVLLDGQQYQYALAAINSFNKNGKLTEAITASTKPPPEPIQQLSAEKSNNQVILSWSYSQPELIHRYIVERRWQSGAWQQVAQTDSQITQWTDLQLMPGAIVNYRVTAVDIDGLRSDPIESEMLVTDNTLTLSAPIQDLLRQVELVWDIPHHAEKVSILRQDKQQNWLEIAQLKPTEFSYTDSQGIIDDSTYHYKFQIWYNGNLVAESNVVSAKTKAIPIPTTLTASSGQAREITLRWQAIDDRSIQSTLVYRWPAGKSMAEAEIIAEVPATGAQTFVDSISAASPIQHGTEYHYALASKNIYDAIGPIGGSVVANSKPLPKPPQNVTATPKNEAVELTWQVPADSGIAKIDVFQKYQHQQQWTLVAQVEAQNRFFAQSDLLPEAPPQFRLRSIDADNLISEYSDTVEVVSPITIGLQADAQALLRTTKMKWQKNAQVEQYQVLRSTDRKAWEEVAVINQNQFTDSKGLNDQSVYYYRVHAIHEGETIAQSKVVEIRTKSLPVAPQKIVVSKDQIKQVTLSWAPVTDSDVSGFIVYRKDNQGKLDKLATLKTNETSYVDKGSFFSKLEHGGFYAYFLTAFNTYKAEGPQSEPVIGETKPLPQAVENVMTVVSNDSVRLMWDANPEPDIESYTIFKGKNCSRSKSIATTDAKTTEYIDKDVSVGQTYCYQIVAIDKDKLEGNLSSVTQAEIPTEGVSL